MRSGRERPKIRNFPHDVCNGARHAYCGEDNLRNSVNSSLVWTKRGGRLSCVIGTHLFVFAIIF